MNRRLAWWLATLAGVVMTVALAVWAPAANGPVFCLFRRGLDLPCPGCGLTRALAHLARGDLAAAVALHPLAPLLAGELVAGWTLLGLAAHGRVTFPGRARLDRWLAATGFLLLAVWIGRLAIGDLSAVRP